eukprot:TRINITY_DN3233_c0_g1_i1.p1 TRINITY_DN3233_c0_g1~~TRINITY_DN3233_c0_g1_i1.p1  ORF type:complete len:334 (-),score=47.15 TRINITY_DN3233_c0_g1_i1:622-1572(-)
MEDESVHSVSISGAALASMMTMLTESRGDFDGIVFGHMSRRVVASIGDDSDMPVTREQRTAVLTGFCSSGRLLSFYDAVGVLDPTSLTDLMSTREGLGDPPIGWFVARRNSPLRPSMREIGVTHHLRTLPPSDGTIVPSSSPCLLFLLSASADERKATHSYDYRVFQHLASPLGPRLEPKPLQVLNIGPDFRGHYESFAPISPFPDLTSPAGRGGDSPGQGLYSMGMAAKSVRTKTLKEEQGAQALLNRQADGYSVEMLKSLMGGEGGGKAVMDLEVLYARMLAKLEILSKDVCESAAAVVLQREANARLRKKHHG